MNKKEIKPRITKVVKGDKINTDGSSIDFVEVKEGCEDRTNGKWFCTTHNKFFRNQFEKDIHINQGEHRLAWICRIHGVEVP